MGQKDALLLASIQQAGGAIYDGQNAADPVTEVNGTNDFSSLTTVSFASSSSSPQNGTWSIQMTHTGGTNSECRGLAALSLENGSTYEVKVYIKEVTGLNWSVYLSTSDGWTTTDSSSISADGVWVEYTLSSTTNSTTPSIRFYGSSSSDGGDVLGIDNIIITKL